MESTGIKTRKIVFLCGARDFHAMDWYFGIKELVREPEIIILTDLITGEGFQKLISSADKIEKLIILDRFLFPKQSSLADKWRNFLKLLVLPLQVYKIKKFAGRNPGSVYYAHAMYYLWLAWLAKVPFVGRPQGSDILIKPYKSRFFRYLSVKALKAAKAVTVDSEKMQEKTFEISGVKPLLIQNGIDIQQINRIRMKMGNRHSARTIPILSMRGFTQLYRIMEIVEGRNNSVLFRQTPIHFIYPFYEDYYKGEVELKMVEEDKVLGRLSKPEMYKLMLETKLVVSIPLSDSSPRSVYESVFCGAVVAITENNYYNLLPNCMKNRIIVSDITKEDWLDEAMNKAEKILKTEYVPSEEALGMFDQRLSFQKVLHLLID